MKGSYGANEAVMFFSQRMKYSVSVPIRKPFVKPIYVKRVLEILDDLNV